MADVSVKMGVSGISQFKTGITQAAASVKSLDSALKLNEKQLKATGDAETYMTQKANLLQMKMNAQKSAAANAEAALKTLKASGVDPLSKSYQDMQKQMLDAEAAMLDTQNEINQLGNESSDAAGKTDQLATSLGGLNKKVSLEQVIGAVGKITDGLENAGKKAVELGKQIWDNIMDAARRADDTATMADMYGIDLQTFKQMQGLVAQGMDTTVDAVLGAQSKMRKAIGTGSDSMIATLKELGLAFQTGGQGGETLALATSDVNELFFMAGQAIMGVGDAFRQEEMAQSLFGKSWKELVPLFKEFKTFEEYSDALQEVDVSSEESTRNLAELNDAVEKLEQTWTSLKDEMLGAIAPALEGAVSALSGLLDKVLEYLQTPEGQKALEDMGKAVEGLFEDLGNIDPDKVVEGFVGVFDKVVGGLQWLEKNSSTVISAMEAIVIGWAGLKITGGALTLYKLIQGIQGLAGGGAAAGAAEAGAATGAAWGSGFVGAVMKAAPWLVGLYTMLNPAGTAGNDLDVLFDESTGKLTTAGWDDYYNNPENWADTLATVGEIFGDLGRITGDVDAVNAMARFKMYGNLEQLIAEIEALGYVKKLTDEEVKPEASAPEEVKQVQNDKTQAFRRDPETRELIPIEPKAPEQAAEQLAEEIGTVETETTPVVPEDAAAQISSAIGSVPVLVVPQLSQKFGFPGGAGGSTNFLYDRSVLPTGAQKANGIPFVPFDGYAAILHKGEQVVPARERETASRNFSSNLYVESMYMNNGTDADGLAAAMAAAQRRTLAGFGS